MARSVPLGDGRSAWSTSSGSSQTRPPPRLAMERPPRPVAPTSASKKRRSTFVASTRPACPHPGGILCLMDLDAAVDPGVITLSFPDSSLECVYNNL
nr:unnamed protein product [Digitaria exilis]